MKGKRTLGNVLDTRKPILAYNPPGLTDLSLAAAVCNAGGIGLIDLERLTTQESSVVLEKAQQQLRGVYGVRVSSKEQLNQVSKTLESGSTSPSILIIGDLKVTSEIVQKLERFGLVILAEVTSLAEAYEKRWATTYLVKGHEAAGRIGDETSFILTQQFADAGLPFIVQGGIGLYTIPAVFAAGAKAVVLDTQLYLTPESPISAKNKTFLSKLDSTDTKILGDTSSKKYRVYARLATRVVKSFLKKEKELLHLSLTERGQALQELIRKERSLFDAPSLDNILLPIGQDIAFASLLTSKFSTVQGIIDNLLEQVKKQLTLADNNFPFTNPEITKKLGVKYSLVQGPMANVSESPEYAKVLASEGALPMLALGSLFPNQSKTLVKDTEKALGNLPYGCGIIGLEANAKARDAHLQIIKDIKPPFVVVAAGTIDQAKQVMGYGVKTFLHTPSPAIFAEAIDAGVKFLVLEGMECGGHIGFLTSFVLWELSIHQIQEKKSILQKSGEKVHVAFAGGIGDRYSAAMAAVVASAAPEYMNGILWVGTAYILTKEIVDTNAIKPLYQAKALDCNETIVLGETVNTRARSIPTPYAREIIARELDRLEQGVSLRERKHQFERDNLGSTRIAAQGMIWNPDGEDDKPNRFKPVDDQVQLTKGNYLIGQIVASLRSVRTVHELHKDLIENSAKVIAQKASQVLKRLRNIDESVQEVISKTQVEAYPTDSVGIGSSANVDLSALTEKLTEGEGVAIVGLGGVFPGAETIDQYWQNIISAKYFIKEIPKERWYDDINLFYDEDTSVPNKSYSKLAATIDDFKFNSIEFKIPPKVAKSMDRVQKVALLAAKEALIDAGLYGKDVDNSRTAVVIGNSMGGEIRVERARLIFAPEVLKYVEQTPAFKGLEPKAWEKIKDEVIEGYNERILPINEDSMPGELSNVIAGRVANIFNLKGKNMTTDAACASSLAAFDVAIKGLLDNDYDAVLCGGADCSLDPTTFIKFSKIGALSARGSFPFDERADGFVMGEGAGFCILKRLSDAVRDGDKIYAVIRGFGSSSDGKGKGITAPNPSGQKLAIDRALTRAGVSIADLQYVECHGTSTRVGDVAEMDVMNAIAKDVTNQSIAIGSVKSQIGHLKSAAGIASMIKTVLALHHKILPPSINFSKPNPKIAWEKSAFYVNTETKEWAKPSAGTRLAGVSSFGFGGTNYHIVLEEYLPGKTRGALPRVLSKAEIEEITETINLSASVLAPTYEEVEVFDAKAWNHYLETNLPLEMEALFIGGTTADEVALKIKQFKQVIPESSFLENGEGVRIRDIAYRSLSEMKNDIRIGFTAKTFEELPKILDTIVDGLTTPAKRLLLRNKGIFYSDDHQIGKIAFLFPGQGSQYVKMGQELYEKYRIVRETFDEADELMKKLWGFTISDIIFAKNKDKHEVSELLRQTEITQPAIFVLNIAIFRLLSAYGIKPDFVAGHSLGEYAALVASGILSFRDGLMAVVPRGQAMAKFESVDKGIMASIGAGWEEAEKILKKIKGYVIAANKNTPTQTVISGSTDAVKEAMVLFQEKGFQVVPLNVSAAFHSKIVEPAVSTFREALEKLTFNAPKIPITSNVTGELYPETREEIIDLLCEQIASPVEWMKQTTKMYDVGVRTFIEIGPKYVLTSFTKAILEPKDDFLALASNHPKKGGMQHFNEVIAALGAFGYRMNVPEPSDAIFTDQFQEPRKAFLKKERVPTALPAHLTKPAGADAFEPSPFSVLINEKIKPIIADQAFIDYLELQAPSITAMLEAGYQTYKEHIAVAMENNKLLNKLNISTEAIGVTGVAVGLPGKDRKVFDESNFDAILSGENFIDQIPAEFREKMVDKNIVRLVKDAIKGAQFQSISDVSEVLKLAAQKGEFDLTEEYGVKKEFAEILDVTFQLSFAAGIEALRDAGIPLMPEKIKTSVGKEIYKGWVLPEPLRDETGIVFASAFPAYSNLISTLSEYLSSKYETAKNEEIIKVYKSLIRRVSDPENKKKIKKWFAKNKKKLQGSKEEKFQFSRKFLFEILSMGHSQFAQFIRARGPNTQVNAACSSTTQAISVAEDWIRTGRCKRVIVISADDVTNEQMLEWIGSGFLAVGAATTKENVEDAALPFDNRRHGMIIGMGAAAMILESASAIEARGIKPIVDLLGTHIVNSAFHGTRLDRDHISAQVDKFISNVERRYGISRDTIAEKMVFVSHETYTPARGGSAAAEIDSLRKAFGPKMDNVVIANTKGFTGHAMGAGIEDVVAVKILEKGVVPPIANWQEPDPELGVLNLSKGGPYDVKYALRFAAGFGSQLTLALYKLHTKGPRFESKAYDAWLASLGGSRDTLEVVKKTLRMKEDPAIIAQQATSTQAAPKAKPAGVSGANSAIVSTIIELISEKTGYPGEMIEADMHLEEDLGIDTVKQAELFGMLRTKYDLPREEGVRIQDYYSVNKIAEYLSTRVTGVGTTDSGQSSALSDSTNSIIPVITELISEKTGYPPEMIEPDMELEEDLGIDTVKQAEIFGLLRSKWTLPREEGIRIQDYSTVAKIAEYISSRITDQTTPASQQQASASNIETDAIEIVPITRQVPKLINAPQPAVEKLSLKGKCFVLAAEPTSFTTKLQSLLEKEQVKEVIYIDLKEANTAKKVKKLLPKDKVDGLIFIKPKTTPSSAHVKVAYTIFTLCRHLRFDSTPLILTILPKPTAFGWTKSKTSPIIGTLTGFTKALARELEGGTVKSVSCGTPEQALTELCSGDGSVEIAFDTKGNRQVFVTVPAEIDSAIDNSQTIPTKEDLILVTGGAQGITFEITKKLAEKYQAKLALVGRTLLPADIAQLAAMDKAALQAKKDELIAKLKEKEERVTPVMIERSWSKVTKAINVYRAVEILNKIGSETRYYSADVSDKKTMKAMLKQAAKDFKQPITAVIHGAGLEVSKLIQNKELADFAKVYDVKALGFDNILKNLKTSDLKFIACFSSVAGRYGNGGQVDYSAANDYLAKSCWQLHQKGVRAFALCWSAWADVGMATRGSIMKVLQHAGVTPIEVEDGITAFINELEFGQTPEVVLAGKLGILQASPLPTVSINCSAFPMVGKVKRNFDGSLVAERQLSLDRDLYLDHHRFDEVPYFPGVMGLEFFAELAKIAYPDKAISRFEDIKFRSAIKLLKNQPKDIRAVISYDEESPMVSIESDFVKDGKKLGDTTTHFTGKLIFGKNKATKMVIPSYNATPLARQKLIYQILPHGTRFQVLSEIRAISQEIIAKTVSVKEEQFNAKIKGLIIDPLAIESGFQTMGLLDIVKDNKMGLPYGIGSLTIYSTKGTPAYVIGSKKSETDFGSIYDFAILSKDGEVLLKATDYRTALVQLDNDQTAVEEIKLQRVKQLFTVSDEVSVEAVSVKEISKRLGSNPDELRKYLHSTELEKYSTYKVPKRQEEWLAGIVVAKLAYKHLHPDIKLNSVHIKKTPLGKPYLVISKREKVELSITHSNGYAVAVVSPKKAIGIDLEVIQKREKVLVDELLSDKEQQFLVAQKQEMADEIITKIWTAKEAASKALGTGLNVDLHALQLISLSDDEVEISIEPSQIDQKVLASDKALAKQKEPLRFRAKLVQNDEYVGAVCHTVG